MQQNNQFGRCPFISSTTRVQGNQQIQQPQVVLQVRQQSPIRMNPIVHGSTYSQVQSQSNTSRTSPIRSAQQQQQQLSYQIFDQTQNPLIQQQQQLSNVDLINEVQELKKQLLETKIQLEQERQKNQTDNLYQSQVPTRSYMDDPDIKWRSGQKPNYSLANEKYLKEKTMNHAKDSLEKVIENAVKTWEMEASHKGDPKQWGSVNPDKFQISSNGGKKFDIHGLIENGTYNTLMHDGGPLYDTKNISRHQSHKTFKHIFQSGFAWEVIKAYAGPPDLAFSWRHWGHAEGSYINSKGVEVPPTGKIVELYGFAIINVDDKLKVNEIQIFEDHHAFLEAIENGQSSSDVAKKVIYGFDNQQ